ncbi:hypothetical protein J4Q44_G00215260 [Coregonus suidteri]|uniref:Pru domain-containing protein n=1 Tax=Coregonus suidteri TaxID=861788 RepID=A0AAN8QLW8_9TELE
MGHTKEMHWHGAVQNNDAHHVQRAPEFPPENVRVHGTHSPHPQSLHPVNSIDCMQVVAAFAVSSVASQWDRTGKLFNPLLGETYELTREDKGYRLISEQVSHHPPISTFNAQSLKQEFEFHGSLYPKLKFWGKSVEAEPKETMTMELLKHKEAYTWTNPLCFNHNTGDKCVLNFKPCGMFGKELHKVEAHIQTELLLQSDSKAIWHLYFKVKYHHHVGSSVPGVVSVSCGSSSKFLVEFRAGKMTMKGSTVTPDKRKGQVYVQQTDDSLIHFCWLDRTSGNLDDDLIIFPDDCEFKRVNQCTTGRVFVLKLKAGSKRLFFWMQEPKTKDE